MAKPIVDIKPAAGKLGVLIPGLGAVATTFIAGVEAVRRNVARPIGSLTQMGTIRLGKRTDNRSPLIKDFLPLAELTDIEFAGWDIYEDNCYEAALKAGVLDKELLDSVKGYLERIKPMSAVFDRKYVRKLDGKNIKKGASWWDLSKQLEKDIVGFKKHNNIERLVMVWCGSTEVFMDQKPVHQTLKAFQEGLRNNDPNISPSMVYAYTAISMGIPFANGAPNLSADIPALDELAREMHCPICGKDFKTGQTLMKTIIGPGLKARLLGLNGWFSTNILGNRDGEVLDDPDSFKTKEVSKLSVLDTVLQPELYPELYKDFYHKVRINYYPPRGDNKEGWDNIDLFGWLGYPMQIKIDFLCRDSILAAPICLDLALFLDFAKRAGQSGIQEWLSFYFKSPMHAPGLYPEHDLFIQLMKLKNNLRHFMSEELITHLGNEYYE
ncbi:MAG: inositol-3-phosphate synthase [Candidatus Krumholzibacteria bacterium]|nr:inositol-3-phosphate synthase [Candidatus Krumholzibacteria bacterium]